jgi:hypothetical protein
VTAPLDVLVALKMPTVPNVLLFRIAFRLLRPYCWRSV